MDLQTSHKILFFVVLAIIFFLVHRWYWKIQLMYNSSSFSMYTPDDIFSISPNLKENTDKMQNTGLAHLKTKSVVITTLLRDAAKNLPQIQRRAEKVGKIFKDYRIIVVENDSSDGTRIRLLEWRKRNPKIIILGCGVNSPEECHIPSASQKTDGHSVDRKRIGKMVGLRNVYLDYIKRNLPHFDYTVMWDMDIIGTVYLDGIINSIGHLETSKNTDGICAYGIYRWGPLTLYYDTYAHLDHGDNFHIDLKTIHDLKKGLAVRYPRGTPPKKVDSCFSGFTIYRTSSLLGKEVRYDMSGEENLECEHVRLHKHLKNMYMNPSMIHLVLMNE